MNWRDFGDCSPVEWAAALPANSEIRKAGESAACYAAASPHSRLCLGMLKAESSYATDFNADPPANKNALNLRPRGGSGFLVFPTWADGVRKWKARLTDPTYAYATTVTLADLVHVYAPASDANNEQVYVATVQGVIDKLTPGGIPMPNAQYDVAGLGKLIALPVPLIQKIIPAGQTNQRPGIARQTPGYWVQHETSNPSPGADAAMHARYLLQGANGGQVSWHFTVDDHQIYQHIPVNEVTWQAADGAGPGNMSGVSCEMCVNADGDEAKARHNAEALCAAICAALGLGPDRVKRHYDFNQADPNRHHCPDHMMNDGYWPTFVQNVTNLMQGGANVPGLTYPTGMDKGLAAEWFGKVKGDDGKTYAFDENGPVSQLWLSTGAATGVYPAIASVRHYDTRAFFRFSSGLTIWQANPSAAVAVLKG